MKYVFELEMEEANLLFEGLSELPMKRSRGLYDKLVQSAQQQSAAEQARHIKAQQDAKIKAEAEAELKKKSKLKGKK